MSTELMIIYGALITCLVGIVGYFLNKQISVIERLTDVVSALNTTVALLQLNQSNSSVNCVDRHTIINNRFASHSEKLHEHGEKISELEIYVTKLSK